MEHSQTIKVQILKAFVENNQGGNPAGIVLDADLLTDAQKLSIAQKVGVSETAFVSKSTLADFKLDFFTPARQIAHCGHATIATFSYLSQTGKIKSQNTSKETIDGKREILMVGDLAFMEQKAPKYIDVAESKNQILSSLGLNESDLLANAPIKLVNTGNSFMIIPLKNQDTLQNIQPDLELISSLSEKYDLIGFYAFTNQTDNNDRDATTRMFAPRYGIEEEAATGMAAGPLACYLYDILKVKKDRFYIQQGVLMKEPSPSLLIADLQLEEQHITKLMVGGKGMMFTEISIEL